jgi:hypothetical protein
MQCRDSRVAPESGWLNLDPAQILIAIINLMSARVFLR